MRILGAAAFTLGIAACTFASPTYITATQEATSEKDGGPEGGAASNAPAGSTSCADDFTKPDVSKLEACGGGKGHCYDANKISFASMLGPCPDASKVCVPNEVLAAGGGKLKSCTSIVGPGGCVAASLFPDFEKLGGSALKQDVCDAGLTCVPCTDPRNGGSPTPVCQPIGVHQNACGTIAAPPASAPSSPPPQAATCCKGRGSCVSESSIPQAERNSTKSDTCASGNKCVPAGAPRTCDGGAFGPGVCVDTCFDLMMPAAASLGLLHTKGCNTTELCVPCGLVMGQGVPGCG
jgi:hypothetical protein